jgi:cysteine desulfurase/selenocysteine lyase
VLTGDEEAALLLPSLHLRDRAGVRVVKVPLCADPAEQVAAFAARLSERTRLVAISHVTTDLGFRLPVAAICALARERGALTFLDLAHSVGLWPIGLRELGCDFAGVLSYKWMYAPYAAGALFVRREQLGTLAVTYAGGRAERWLDFEGDAYALHESAGRFQFGPWSWPLVHAWAAALDYLDGIGVGRIWARTATLTGRLKAGLAEIPGVTIHTPPAADCSAALVTFGLAGWTGEALRLVLRERWGIIIKPLPHGREGLRASLPFFLLEEEVDLLVAAVRELAEGRERETVGRPCQAWCGV